MEVDITKPVQADLDWAQLAVTLLEKAGVLTPCVGLTLLVVRAAVDRLVDETLKAFVNGLLPKPNCM